MRDARINTIGEGANEVLLAFIGVVGMRDVRLGLKSTLEGLMRPRLFFPTLWSFSRVHLGRMIRPPAVAVSTPMLRPLADSLARHVARFAWSVERVLITHREAVLKRQLVLERNASAAIALVTAACTLARLDAQLVAKSAMPGDREAAELYLRMVFRRCDESLRALSHNDDGATLAAADAALRRFASRFPVTDPTPASSCSRPHGKAITISLVSNLGGLRATPSPEPAATPPSATSIRTLRTNWSVILGSSTTRTLAMSRSSRPRIVGQETWYSWARSLSDPEASRSQVQ